MDKGLIMKNLHLLLVAILGISLTTPSWAILTKLSEESIANSEEPFSRRIYSYDFDVSKDGIVHAVYSQPVPGGNKTHIIYTNKPVGGTFQQRNILETDGSIPSISTYLIYDDNTMIAGEKKADGTFDFGPKVQFKEAFAVGLIYKFSN